MRISIILNWSLFILYIHTYYLIVFHFSRACVCSKKHMYYVCWNIDGITMGGWRCTRVCLWETTCSHWVLPSPVSHLTYWDNIISCTQNSTVRWPASSGDSHIHFQSTEIVSGSLYLASIYVDTRKLNSYTYIVIRYPNHLYLYLIILLYFINVHNTCKMF